MHKNNEIFNKLIIRHGGWRAEHFKAERDLNSVCVSVCVSECVSV